MDLVILTPVYNDMGELGLPDGRIGGVFLPYTFCSCS